MNSEDGLVTHGLKARIVRLLEANYKRTGRNEPVSWRVIWIEAGVKEDEFCKVLNAIAQEYPPAIVFADSDRIMLGQKAGAETKAARGGTQSTETHNSAALRSRVFLLFGRSSLETAKG